MTHKALITRNRMDSQKLAAALRDEQASKILDALEKIETVPITIGLTKSGEVFARNSSACCVGTSYRDALAKLVQLEIAK